MTAVTEVLREPEDWQSVFAFDELVFPGVEDGPRLGEDVWDLRAVVAAQTSPLRALYLSGIEGSYRTVARELLLCLAQPEHPAIVAAGVVPSTTRGSVGTLQQVVRHLAVISLWGVDSGLDHLSDWRQHDVERFLSTVKAGAYTPEGKPLAASTVRQYVKTLKDLRHYSPVLSGGGFGFMPWGATTAATVAGATRSAENVTRPMPLSMWEPLIAGAWKIVSQFSPDIIAATETRAALPGTSRAVSGNASWPTLEAWLDAGNTVPLHTGYGRHQTARGEINYTLLCRLANVSDAFLKRTHRTYLPEAVTEIQRRAQLPGGSRYGGLVQPTVTVPQPDGVVATWVSEIGLGEAEHFESVLRGACYIIIASLTGMRDSEIQGLRRNCVTTVDGIKAITSVQIKGRAGDVGSVRTWWAPPPAIKAAEVLDRISPHRRYLFARSERDGSVYNPSRDIARVIDFLNAEPGDRVGRGSDLGLAKIDLSSRVPVNQTTLRRSFSVIAAHRPGAELGLGIQLGHAALRMTSGYAMDSTQQAAQLFDEARIDAMRIEAARVLRDVRPAAGMRADEVVQFRGQLAADDSRADSIIEAFAETYQVGVFNDCMYQEERAGCGPGGPKLASQHCATSSCSNALFLTRHRPSVQAQIDNIDAWLDRGTGHPGVLEQLREERARLARILRQLNTNEGGVADASQDSR